ncbi:MspA family porin [Rhodococcus tukisamuensis]|uniref:MspA protein n=1 Tax=Rhodococcus tukisamuensis TaxID=168276 RepID=A0A1G6U7R3_9NOCA|nr:MspA family porin [Rhodococcus tukisamuensis]SDD36605.1 MspA protein [Rhodococcus tukisamuensis]
MTDNRKRRRNRKVNATRALAAAGAALLGITLGGGTASAGVDNANSIFDDHGNRLEVSQGDTSIQIVPPLDSSPLSREFFHNGYAQARIEGPGAADAKGSKLTFGYQVGYPVALTGASIQLNTPGLGFELEHKDVIALGDVTDDFALGIGFENRGQLLGDIIPQQNFIFDLQPGGITDVPVVKDKMFDGPGAKIRIGGVQGSVSGAIGQTTIRPYARLETADGNIVMTYGMPVPL